MNLNEEALLKRLRVTFLSEAEEHMRVISAGLIEIRRQIEPDKRSAIIEASFRSSHSLKGASAAVNLPEIESICHALESVWAAVKKGVIEVNGPLLEILTPAADELRLLLGNIEARRLSADKSRMKEIIRRLEQAAKGKISMASTVESPQNPAPSAPLPAEPPDVPTAPGLQRRETLRVEAGKLDELLYQSEELLVMRLAMNDRVTELEKLRDDVEKWRRRSVEAFNELRRFRAAYLGSDPTHEPEEIAGLYDFLDWGEGFTRYFQDRLSDFIRSADQSRQHSNAVVDRLLDDVKQIVVDAFSTIVESLPRAMRELAEAEGKPIEVLIEGGEIEMDRRILQEMKDPLLHLARNGVDHGLESPEERLRNGKPAQGLLRISARPAPGGNFIEILVSDDGRGIDVEVVRKAAVKAKLVTEARANRMNEDELLSLVLLSGFSTRSQTTDISGRGMGLAIVQERVERLGGTISIETQLGVSTTFRIRLPLRLANYRGLLIEVAGRQFVVPSTRIARVIRFHSSELVWDEEYAGSYILTPSLPVVSLADVLGLQRKSTDAEPKDFLLALVLSNSQQQAAFLVDRILDEQEVIVKNLGTQLAPMKNIEGATVLGTGRIVLILNTFDLLRAIDHDHDVSFESTHGQRNEKKNVSILLVEDSFTSRELLLTILEEAGYQVQTAPDGLAAWLMLQNEKFDLVVSDIEMPRLSGIDLTARIRANPRLTDLPVVLVTALASEDDRRRGVEIGANAYIVKQGFGRSDLLETVNRLI
jgi:two-component system, chemotaxis family, sensor kinase CheA